VFVAPTEAEASAEALRHYGHPAELRRDPDVLDTWFSSALWPFSTLGWPEQTPELARYYPTDVLVTGFDIIFFWVARMMMMGLHFLGEVPFHTVYIHALVRDEKGQKMSKTRGNVIDPLQLIDRYGADALRFTLTALAVQGRDVKLAESRVEGYRNFCTKIWNAARFCQLNGATLVEGYDPYACDDPVNRWLVGKLLDAAEQADEALANYRFNDYAGVLYHFTWGTFCDWYLEFAKSTMLGGSPAAQAEARAVAAWGLDQILRLLHPVMPFVTEELFQSLADRRGEMLITHPWPLFDRTRVDDRAIAEIDWVVRLISLVRAVRTEMNVPPGAKIPLLLKDADDAARTRLADYRHLIISVARLSSAETLDGEVPSGAIQDAIDGATLVLPIAGVIDVAAERARLAREMAKLDDEIARVDRKLANDSFVAKAKPEVVEVERERRAEALAARGRLDEAVRRLAGL
jgi:valyl-tRNA synthetase